MAKFGSHMAAIVILAAVIAVAVAGVGIPYVESSRELRGEIEELEHQLSRYRALNRQVPQLTQALKQAQARLQFGNRMLSGDSAALAAADLQDDLKRIVGERGGQVRSTQALPIKEESGFERIAVRLRMVAGIRELRSVLTEIVGNRPALVVDAVSIDTDRGQAKRMLRDKSVPAQLLVVIELHGYREKRDA